ncbi:hypothetical protein THAOC_12826 [Thalassiosira oceanica]|uniref:CHCH domain-containing protein n=1 Tax=Thalassiosira oceanica TaxID=159749 RepID=K0SZ32_THAOC|nr:hypothetical protein THAOC_12826 [Thalassiosira oceanica]|mmetsp:Transcript_29682/g.70537  ORF Transcript_29682/g.70537 Transcript_29682/m.70537 type:complete len:126 (+) Transcript_29682:146-523(+)|eukprot:EJK66266.1 hypothetical protein THAOC_12826 [Thalassiosira oceanica]
MGASQSSGNDNVPPASSSADDEPTPTPTHQPSPPQAPQSARGDPRPSNKNESGFQRAQRKCRKKKRDYDACYTAQLASKEEDCADLFDAYRSCFMSVISRDMEKRGVFVNSNSMVGEFKDEEDDG